MVNNVLLFFWDEGKMGYSRKIKRCFWPIFSLKVSENEDILLKIAEFSGSKCAFIFLEVGLNGLFQKNKMRLC
jgi:hypothetical protein